MEIPLPYIRANQVGIVLLVIASLVFTPWILLVLWVIQIVGLLSGGRLNLFVRAVKPWLNVRGKQTQSAELAAFNNALAVIFLTLSVGSFALGWTIAAYVFAVMLLLAASAALLGYCIGCTIYYQFKRLRHKV